MTTQTNGRPTRGTKVINTTDATEFISLDPTLRRFFRECMSCQSPGIAAWATKIMRARQMTMADLTRCFVLGFEG